MTPKTATRVGNILQPHWRWSSAATFTTQPAGLVLHQVRANHNSVSQVAGVDYPLKHFGVFSLYHKTFVKAANVCHQYRLKRNSESWPVVCQSRSACENLLEKKSLATFPEAKTSVRQTDSKQISVTGIWACNFTFVYSSRLNRDWFVLKRVRI